MADDNDDRPTEKNLGIKQIPWRYRKNTGEYALFRKLMFDDGINFQCFVDACVESYVRRDKDILSVVKVWKDQQRLPKRKEDALLSRRDKVSILNEIAALEEMDDEKTST